MQHPTDRITHTTAFVTPIVEHWLEREIAQWVHRNMSERSTSEPRPAPALTNNEWIDGLMNERIAGSVNVEKDGWMDG